jgi:hypothetical protein
VRRIARDDALGAFAPGESRAKRVVSTAAHDAPQPRFRDGRFLVRQRQGFDGQTGLEPQSQFRGGGSRHFIEAGERGEGFGQRVRVGERRFGFLQGRAAWRMFGMLLQQRA